MKMLRLKYAVDIVCERKQIHYVLLDSAELLMLIQNNSLVDVA